MVATFGAGGVGISFHDIHGKYPRVSLLNVTYSATQLKQSLGRIHRAGSLSKAVQYIYFASGTQEELAYHRVHAKLKNISALNDGDLIGGVL